MAKKKTTKEIVQSKYPEFPEAVDGLSVDDLKKKILEYSKEQENTAAYEAKLNEPGQALHLAKEAVAEITGPINDTRKAIRLKISYLVGLIEEKGGSVP